MGMKNGLTKLLLEFIAHNVHHKLTFVSRGGTLCFVSELCCARIADLV